MNKYETFKKKSKHRQLRKKVFQSLELKENRYKHTIPRSAVEATLKRHGLHSLKAFRISSGMVYYMKDKKGRRHGDFVDKGGKVRHWKVE